jgi:hypothetical protein
MYFKISIRKNPASGLHSGYYRLVESYRNENDRICHRTILNIGYLEGVKAEQLNIIQKILSEKVKHSGNTLFEYPTNADIVIQNYVESFYNQIVDQKRIDLPGAEKNKKTGNSKKDLQLIDLNSIKNKDIREIGSEWLAYQALNQLEINTFLKQRAWAEEDIQLALTHIISRAVYPASELCTSRWIQENSAVCEITGYDINKISKDKLYKISKKLFSEKQLLEQHLSKRTNELFDIEDKIVLFDLTNTYFEGRKIGSKLAKFGRSKEKRNDAKLVVLALVINPEGFIKYSNILQGNMADCKTLSDMIETLRINTSQSAKKALVVIDAGISTEDNLAMIVQKGYDYLCVSRSNLTNYTVNSATPTVFVLDNKKQKIELTKVNSASNTDYYLKIHSFLKEQKERSMNEQFRERFEIEIKKIEASLTKKGGVKQADKVHQRIGRLKQKYPSIQKYFDIETTIEEVKPKQKSKNIKPETRTNQIVSSLKWSIKQDIEVNSRCGIYFLRTSLTATDETLVWKFYNTIREIEATFRVLKTDLDLRPIYHKTDDNTMAHLHLGLLAYWVVNTIRFQLKNHKINLGWKEIVRIMNTQKAVTTVAQNNLEEVICVRKCSEPNQKVKQIYDTLKYRYAPFVRKKSVVHKADFQNFKLLVLRN